MSKSLYGVPVSIEYGDFSEGHIVSWGDDMPSPHHQVDLVKQWRETHLPSIADLIFLPDWSYTKDYVPHWTCWKYNAETDQIEPWWQYLLVTVGTGSSHVVHLPVGNYDQVILAWLDYYFPGAGSIRWQEYTGSTTNMRCWEYDPATKTIR